MYIAYSSMPYDPPIGIDVIPIRLGIPMNARP